MNGIREDVLLIGPRLGIGVKYDVPDIDLKRLPCFKFPVAHPLRMRDVSMVLKNTVYKARCKEPVFIKQRIWFQTLLSVLLPLELFIDELLLLLDVLEHVLRLGKADIVGEHLRILVVEVVQLRKPHFGF